METRYDIAGQARSSRLIHYGSSSFDREEFNPILHNGWVKPEGGLWTSPVDSKYGWKQWCTMEDAFTETLTKHFYLNLTPEARIYVIDSLEDLHQCPKCMGLLDQVIDFPKMAREYDAIWLTTRGQQVTRYSFPMNLYGWDCESVLLLNAHCFTL